MQNHDSRSDSARRTDVRDTEVTDFESTIQELSLDAARELIRSLQSRQLQLEQQVAELQRCIEFQHAIFDSLPSHIAVLDSDGVIVAVNKAWQDFGYQNGARNGSFSVGTNYLQVCQSSQAGADTGASAMATGIREILECKRTNYKYEYPCYSTIENRWFQASVHAMPLSIPGVVVSHSDVTGLVGDRELRLIINSMPGPVSRVDRELRYVFANDKYEKIFGLPAELVVGRTMPEVIGQERFDFVEPYVRRALAGEKVSFESEVALPTGEILTTVTHFLPDIDVQNCVIGFVVVGLDITDRTLAEKAIKERTAFLEALLESVHAGILAVNGEGKKLLQNSRMNVMWKLPQEIANDLDDSRQVAFVTERTKNRQEFADKVAYLYSHPSEVSRDEIELIDGTMLDRYSAPVCDRDGTYYGRIWTFNDITELRFAKAEAEARERELRIITNTMPGPVACVDRNLRYRYLNKYYEKIAGRPVDTLIGMRMPEVVGARLWQQAMPNVERVLAGEHRTFESHFFTSSGERRDLRVHLFPEFDSTSQVVGFYVIGFDISENKQAEAEKQEALDRLQKVASRLPGCVFQFRMRSDGTFCVPYVSEGMRDIGRLEAGDVREDASKLFSLHHPDDHPGIMESIAISARDLTPWSHEFRILFEDGSVRWIASNSIPERESDGSILWHGFMSDVTARKQAETALRIRDKALDSISQGVLITDREGKILSANPAFYVISGYSEQDLANQNTTMFRSGRMVNETLRTLLHAHAEGIEFSGEVLDTRKDGKTYWNDLTISPVRDESGRVTHFVGVSRDITARKQAEEDRNRLESQLRQAQRLESIGRLAGGVAHDFNNMLGVILGHAELGLLQLQQDERIYSNLEQIQKAALRSADLTRQLLAFARRQAVTPRPLDLNANVERMLSLLARLIGEDISIKWSPCKGLWLVKVDSSQMEQILTNLCVNSRDAIQGVGTISIETQNYTVTEADCAHWIDAVPGEYVRLIVNDDGIGMDAQTLSQIFEPFFTTKTDGKGTGLGLATVYGAIRQNMGFVAVSSTPGKGSTFSIYLPRYLGPAQPVQEPAVATQPPRGRETILVVEDEPALLELTCMILQTQGYNALAAATPAEAQRLAIENADKIVLLVTDVIMPEMNGRDLADLLQKFCPKLKRLFMSGYTADVIAQSGALDDGTYFIQKPFTPSVLATKLREVLEASEERHSTKE